jgi:hypothetical protein
MVGRAEGLEAGEVLDGLRSAGRSRRERLVDAEDVRIAMDQDDWLAGAYRLPLKVLDGLRQEVDEREMPRGPTANVGSSDVRPLRRVFRNARAGSGPAPSDGEKVPGGGFGDRQGRA